VVDAFIILSFHATNYQIRRLRTGTPESAYYQGVLFDFTNSGNMILVSPVLLAWGHMYLSSANGTTPGVCLSVLDGHHLEAAWQSDDPHPQGANRRWRDSPLQVPSNFKLPPPEGTITSVVRLAHCR
jgi:hypothetical protein